MCASAPTQGSTRGARLLRGETCRRRALNQTAVESAMRGRIGIAKQGAARDLRHRWSGNSAGPEATLVSSTMSLGIHEGAAARRVSGGRAAAGGEWVEGRFGACSAVGVCARA
eukprot:1045896-Pleurochrysis_carterae.AAC.2